MSAAAVITCLPVAQPQNPSAYSTNERFYTFGTPSPPSVASPSEYSYSSELEDSGFHSDEDIQKVIILVCLLVVDLWFIAYWLFTWLRLMQSKQHLIIIMLICINLSN